MIVVHGISFGVVIVLLLATLFVFGHGIESTVSYQTFVVAVVE